MMRRLLFLLLSSTALAACGDNGTGGQPGAAAVQQRTAEPTAEEIAAETARLNEWFDARYEESLQRSPIATTFLGRKDNYDKIDDLSEKAEDEELDWRRKTVAEMRDSFDYDLLTPDAQISYDLWVHDLERAESALPYRRRGYVFTQMQGPQAFLPQFLINFHKVDDESDMEAYVARIAGVSRALGQLLERAQLAAGEGVRPPRFAYEGVIEQARALTRGAPFGGEGEAPLWADAKAKIAALEESGAIEPARADALRAEAEAALTEDFKPAYDALIAWMEEDMPNTDVEAAGVWKLPDGRDFYEERLSQSTTTSLSAAEIHQIGLDEVARLIAEMEAIKAKTGFDGSLQEFFVFMREDDRFFFPNTDEGREGYLQAARDYLAFIDERLPDYFGILPKAGLVVKRVEAFREQDGAAQHYFPGSPDGARDGIYYAHLSDMRAMPKPMMEVIAYHEGNPGHHMQISIAQELEDVPEFRTQGRFTAYIEGWGLYAEYLAKEMGAFEDPYNDFGRLTSEIWRAIRLVVDTGIHDKGWTEEQAVEYFLENSPIAEGQVRSEVKRYFAWPGQATAYKIGMMKILELREKARAELGGDFDIRAFHDTVLGGGAMPLSVLERRVDNWIAARKAA